MTLPSYGGRREMTATRHTATLCACASFFHFVHLEREREREREIHKERDRARESESVWNYIAGESTSRRTWDNIAFKAKFFGESRVSFIQNNVKYVWNVNM